MIGKTLAHYEITALLGKGGMGEVFRAQDTKLGREVAIKVLPKEMSGDPERAARFDREARTLASLQHPNIASIYGFEEVEGQRFLVMELVEGTELGDRIPEGGMPLDELRRIGGQIATGLEAAHERSIVHRDLKPANIMIDPNGNAKILDFGLARAWFGDEGDDTVLANSPTITAAMTQAGTILGTAAYMSPEQARGRNVDPRADIWAFGAILWEMATGRRLFEGETISDTLAAVLRAEPQWNLLPVDQAPRLCRLIERCLVRDPRQRLRDIGEARILLCGDGTESSILALAALENSTDANTAVSRRNGPVGLFLAVLLGIIAATLATIALTRESGPEVTRTTLGFPVDQGLQFNAGSTWSSLRFTEDNRSLMYVAGNPTHLYLRDIDSFEAKQFSNTEGAQLPVFSPDGKWIAYFADSKIWKVAVSGGAPVELLDAVSAPGLEWGDGELYFCKALGGGLWAVSEEGGDARAISSLSDEREETSHRFPQTLPDGRHILMTVKTARIESFDDASIAVLDLQSGESKILLQGGSNPRYVDSGHILYGRDSQLFCVPFNLATMALEGTPISVLDGVQTDGGTGTAYFAVNSNLDLAYVPAAIVKSHYQISWFDRLAGLRDLDEAIPNSFDASLSRDGIRIATIIAGANDKVWIYDLEQESLTRLTDTPGNDRTPVWAPDGESIVYRNDRSGSSDLYRIRTDGTAQLERLTETGFADFPNSFSPDGKELLFTRIDADLNADVWLMDMGADANPTPLLDSARNESEAQFSPTGDWIAYVSDAGGESDVYIRAYPSMGAPIRVSRSGGNTPVWAQDGMSIFFKEHGRLMETTLDRNDGITVDAVRELVDLDVGFSVVNSRISPTPDGQRFLVSRLNPGARQNQIRIIFNWGHKLTELAPRGG